VITQLKVVYESKVLCNTTSRGLPKLWKIYIKVSDSNDYYIVTEYWQINKDGNETIKQHSEPKLVKCKNEGKKNETKGYDQAILEVNSLINKQKDKGYRDSDGETLTNILPMLAYDYNDKKHIIKFPCYVQPKLDGCRCLYDGKTFWSRNGKAFLDDVVKHLHFDTSGHVIDGELILPSNMGSFQDTISAVKRFTDGLSDRLVYYVYDVVDEHKGFNDRYKMLSDIIKHNPHNIVLVDTFEVTSEEDIKSNHNKFVNNGFEGSIIRLGSKPYSKGQRCNQLLKYKDFNDKEFEIVEIIDGEGKDKDCAICVCRVNDTTPLFRVRLTGTNEYRKHVYQSQHKYIGKMLTVKFQGYTKDGIPRFPVGLIIRDYE